VAKLTISIQVRGRATSTRQILAQRVRTFHPSLTAPQSEGRYTIRVTASGGGTTQTIDATINVT
jgi:ribosomal protein S9